MRLKDWKRTIQGLAAWALLALIVGVSLYGCFRGGSSYGGGRYFHADEYDYRD